MYFSFTCSNSKNNLIIQLTVLLLFVISFTINSLHHSLQKWHHEYNVTVGIGSVYTVKKLKLCRHFFTTFDEPIQLHYSLRH